MCQSGIRAVSAAFCRKRNGKIKWHMSAKNRNVLCTYLIFSGSVVLWICINFGLLERDPRGRKEISQKKKRVKECAVLKCCMFSFELEAFPIKFLKKMNFFNCKIFNFCYEIPGSGSA
jgi:hypothetical protein